MTEHGTPWLSVLTPSYNQGRFLERNLESVSMAASLCPGVEQIVMDGGSIDETVEILQRGPSHVIWDSRPDAGQTDALRKAFLRARGDIVGWLNVDEYYEPEAFKTIRDIFESDPGIYVVYGDFRRVSSSGEEIRINRQWKYDRGIGTLVTPIIQNCSAFFRRSRLEEIDAFSETSFHYAMDWDLYIRMMQAGKAVHVPKVLGNFTMHADAKTSQHYDEFLKEIWSLRRSIYPTLPDWRIDLIRRYHYLRMVRQMAVAGILWEKVLFKGLRQRKWATEFGTTGPSILSGRG